MSMLGKPGNKTESAAVIQARIGVYLGLSALALLLNGTFLIVICKNWTFVKRRRITYHVTNLAISDSLYGVSAFCYFISTTAAGRETALSSAFTTIAWTACLTSLLAVCLMAIERAVCIKKPHTWNQILPLKRILMVMAGNWVLTLALAIILHFYTLAMMFVLLVLFCITIFVTAAMYTNVYVKIWKTKSNEIDDGTLQTSSTKAIKQRRNKLMQQKVGSFVLILTMVLVITVSPSFLTLSVKMACELFELNCKTIETINILAYYFYMLEMVNFVVNPIFYVWRMSMYRKAFWKMLGRAHGEKHAQSETESSNRGIMLRSTAV